MENLIESRVILGLLCFIHILLGYAGAGGAVHDVINKKVLNALILAELVGVTAYVVFDNLQMPPYNGWLLAIVGYVIVYGLIIITWFVYRFYTFMEKDKVYEMTVVKRVYFLGRDYVGGVIKSGKQEVEVLLPYEEYPSDKRPKKVKVKFYVLMEREYIVSAV